MQVLNYVKSKNIISSHFLYYISGEEIFVHYGYDLDGCPDWYEEAWQRGTYPVPDSLQEELLNWEESDYNRSTDCTRLKDIILKDEKI